MRQQSTRRSGREMHVVPFCSDRPGTSFEPELVLDAERRRCHSTERR